MILLLRMVLSNQVKAGDIPFIRGGDLLNGRILSNQLRTITKEVSDQYVRTLLRGGELLISLVGLTSAKLRWHLRH